MNKSSLIIVIIFGISVYQVFQIFKKEDLVKSKEVNVSLDIKKINKKKPISDKREDVNRFVMEDNRINPIAPKSKINKKNSSIRNRVPKNLERILQYEMKVWERGLTETEISDLISLWDKYSSNGIFGKKEKNMLDRLDKRNILNAIRASKPTIIKEQEEINKEEEKEILESNREDYDYDKIDERERYDIEERYEEYEEVDPIVGKDVRDDRIYETEYPLEKDPNQEFIDERYEEDLRTDDYYEDNQY
jgi:hypothetical protein